MASRKCYILEVNYTSGKNPYKSQQLQFDNKDIRESPGEAEQGKSRICTKERLLKEERKTPS